MSKIRGGHIVARYFKEVENVGAVFSLSGGHIDLIYNGLKRYGVRLIDMRHEQAAAMAAHAWSIYAGSPGVCLVTAGPGFTNALTGVINACQEAAPMVFISGRSPLQNNEMGALQEMNQIDMVKGAVKHHAVCYDIRRLPEYLFNAFRQAAGGRPGPVYLELPPEVLNGFTEEEELEWPGKGGAAAKPGPDASLIKPAAELINHAERPLIIAGNGVGHADCGPELKEFIEKTGIPFFLGSSGRGVLPDEHPLSLWDGGIMGITTAMGQADLVIALGIRFNYIMGFGRIFPQAKLIRVDIDPTELDRNRKSDIGIAADLKPALSQLGQAVEKRDHSSWRKGLREAYTPIIQGEIEAANTPSHPIHPVRLAAKVREVFGDDALYVVDGGDTSYYGATGLRATGKAGVMPSAGGPFGCLGTGIPFALAAKAAQPDKTVVVLNGDGSFGFNAMEFETAIRHNLPFICVINNDCSWGMIRHGQRLGLGEDQVFGSELGMIHYEKMVEGLGGYGELIEKDEDIAPALQRALKSSKPACINVITDMNAVSMMTYVFMDGLKTE